MWGLPTWHWYGNKNGHIHYIFIINYWSFNYYLFLWKTEEKQLTVVWAMCFYDLDVNIQSCSLVKSSSVSWDTADIISDNKTIAQSKQWGYYSCYIVILFGFPPLIMQALKPFTITFTSHTSSHTLRKQPWRAKAGGQQYDGGRLTTMTTMTARRIWTDEGQRGTTQLRLQVTGCSARFTTQCWLITQWFWCRLLSLSVTVCTDEKLFSLDCVIHSLTNHAWEKAG